MFRSIKRMSSSRGPILKTPGPPIGPGGKTPPDKPLAKYLPNQTPNAMKKNESTQKSLVQSIQSWFCVPDQGMTELEILCRGSAFLVRANNTEKNMFRPKWHVVTCSHVVAPWKWPNLYPDEWLKFVNMDHTHYSMESRGSDGNQNATCFLNPWIFHHPTRDLAVMHIEGEDNFMGGFGDAFMNTKIKLSDVENLTLPVDTAIQFHGHTLPIQTKSSKLDTRRPVPKVVNGRVAAHGENRIFGLSEELLHNGMCGGPVILSNSVYNANKFGSNQGALAVGMLEGIVPTDHSEVDLQGAPVWIEAATIREFLRDIEEGNAKSEDGGAIISYVGRDYGKKGFNWESEEV